MTNEQVSPFFEEESCTETDPNPHEYIGLETSLDNIASILDATIKQDDTAKRVAFLSLLLNYTEDNQQNVGFVSVSSSGKSYIPCEIAKFFPSEDVMLIQHQTPKALYHSHGVLVRDDGGTEFGPRLKEQGEYVREALTEWKKSVPRGSMKAFDYREALRTEKTRLKEEWDKIPKGILVDLRQRILVFLDQPDWRLMDELKPILSHDAEVTRSSITDKSKSGAISTKTVFIRGYPTVVFLTVKTDLDEQVRNRMILLSASVSKEKIEDALSLINERASDEEFDSVLESDDRRIELRYRILGIKHSGIGHVYFKRGDIDQVKERFLKKHKVRIPRHMRDYPRLLSLIKAHALLNYSHRERKGSSIYVNETDIREGEVLYDKIAVANELGIEPELYEFVRDILNPALDKVSGDGLSITEFRKLWYGYAGSQLSEYSLKRKLEMLETVGEVEIRKDGRYNRIYSTRYHTVFEPVI